MEDEFHITCVCPQYDNARQDLLREAPGPHALATHQDIMQLLSGTNKLAFQASAKFYTRALQIRRRLKCQFEVFSDRLERKSFAGKRTAWRMRRKYSCRHGVLFSQAPPNGCKCMSLQSGEEDWHDARYMPALDHDLKAIVAVKFDKPSFKRLAILQADMRRLGW